MCTHARVHGPRGPHSGVGVSWRQVALGEGVDGGGAGVRSAPGAGGEKNLGLFWPSQSAIAERNKHRVKDGHLGDRSNQP